MGILVTNSNSKSIVFSDMTGRNKSVFCASIAILIRVGDDDCNKCEEMETLTSRVFRPK